MPQLPTFLTGWEGPTVALAVFGAAFSRNSTTLAVFAAVLSSPFCVFAVGYPIVGRLAWSALAGNILAACFVSRRREIAFAALTPFLAMCTFLAILAARGIRLVHS